MNQMKNKILITGATGFIGSHLAEQLTKDGNDIRCLVRKTSSKAAVDYLKSLGAELVYGDALDKESLRIAINDVSIIYHLAAIFNYMTPEDKTFDVNVEGTKNLLDVCLNSDIKKFILCSTIGVMGPTGRNPACETTPCNPDTSAYARSKYEEEKLALNYFSKYKLPLVVIRPAPVYGPKGFYSWYNTFKMTAQGKSNFILGSGENLVSAVYVTDVVQGLILAEEKGRIGEVYIIAEKSTTLKNFSKMLAEILGVKPPTKSIPSWLAKLMAYFYEVKSKVDGKEPLFTRATINFAISDHIYDTSKAKRELGYEPKVSLEKGTKQTIEWFRENKYL